MKAIRFNMGVGTEEIVVLLSTRENRDWKNFTEYYGIIVPDANVFAFQYRDMPTVWIDLYTNPNSIISPLKGEFQEYAKKLAKVNEYFKDSKNVDTFYYQMRELIKLYIPSGDDNSWKFFKYDFEKHHFNRVSK